jgi:gas vesicle protein
MYQNYANELDPSYFRFDRYDELWNRSGSTVGMFLLGAGIGFAAAMLFAPKSGAELRSQLSDAGGDLFERARGFGDNIRERVSRVVPENMREQVSDVFDQARSRAEDLAHQAKQSFSSFAHGAGQRGSGRDIDDLLNNVSKDVLTAVKGIGPVLAERIIRFRPYRSERELLDKDVISRNDFDVLKRELLYKIA